MTNFKESFGKGLKAAGDVEAKLAEIESVFLEMNKQLSEASDGKIQITREARASALDLFTMGVLGKSAEPSAPRTTYIVATNPLAKGKNKEDIGVWEIDKHGYPCQIKFGNDSFYCEDKRALEQTLSTILTDPDVGRALQRLLNLNIDPF
ncbi:hypothetical protein ACX3YD_08950 [Pseudomonas fluorescens group sp. PF-1]